MAWSPTAACIASAICRSCCGSSPAFVFKKRNPHRSMYSRAVAADFRWCLESHAGAEVHFLSHHAAEQFTDGQIRALAHGVPKCHLNARHRAFADAPCFQRCNGPFDVGHIFARQNCVWVRFKPARSFAPTHYIRVRFNFHDKSRCAQSATTTTTPDVRSNGRSVWDCDVGSCDSLDFHFGTSE